MRELEELEELENELDSLIASNNLQAETREMVLQIHSTFLAVRDRLRELEKDLEDEVCDECQGSGDCDECGGEGHTEDLEEGEYETCEDCNGSGQCWSCKGKE